jgi:nucleolar protein 53
VEVDIPGCSFNPDLEQHQDAVAEAVAAEMTKIYAREHMPKSKKLFNHMPAVDELETLLV